MSVGSSNVQRRLAQKVECYVASFVSLVKEELSDRGSVQEAGEVKIRVPISNRGAVVVVQKIWIMLQDAAYSCKRMPMYEATNPQGRI